MKNKITAIILLVVFLLPNRVWAATILTGKEIYHGDEIGNFWGVSSDSITKITSPGSVYSINDFGTYTAYATNNVQFVGNSFEKSVNWNGKSRLLYLKLFKVTPGQSISFVFDDEYYVSCAEYNTSFKLVDEGDWFSTGETIKLSSSTAWIMLIFRHSTGDKGVAANLDVEITVNDLMNSKTRYVVFAPFTYTFKMNGGAYKNSTNDYVTKRYGVEKLVMPVPTRTGYTFGGWKASDGKIYKGTLGAVYNAALFKNSTFTAVWNPVTSTSVTLDKNYVILEPGEIAAKLVATVMPSNTLNKTITWTTEDDTIATVSSTGVITAKSSGITNIVAANGSCKASCKVYVVGFELEVPNYCTLDEIYEIKVNVRNNGSGTMNGRKHIRVEASDSVTLSRVGDTRTTYKAIVSKASEKTTGFSRMTDSCLLDTMDTASVYYKLSPEKKLQKAGDYEGQIDFSVVIS